MEETRDFYADLLGFVVGCQHPPIKVFLDRITDYLDIPELLDEGQRAVTKMRLLN
jgi:hypothetical protein